MSAFEIGSKWGQATIESCREADALAPGSPSLLVTGKPKDYTPYWKRILVNNGWRLEYETQEWVSPDGRRLSVDFLENL
jgi:hypothetical protein